MTKKLSILIILLLSSFQLAMANAVSVAAKQLEDNYNNVVITICWRRILQYRIGMVLILGIFVILALNIGWLV